MKVLAQAGQALSKAPAAPLPASHLEAFVSHLQAGDAAAALRAASDACHAAPDRAEPHYAYGKAWLAVGEPQLAEKSLAAALKIAPHWADAWVEYGVARYQQGAIGHAMAAMRQALLRQAGHAAAIANLAGFMRLSGEFEAAEALLQTTLERDPDAIGARLNRAVDLLQDELAAEALDLLDDAFEPRDDLPAQRHWFLQKSLALIQLGRLAEARHVVDVLATLGPVPSAVQPLWLWRHVLLAIAEGDRDAGFAAAEQMAAALAAAGPDTLLEHRIMGHYNLAGLWSREGKPERAMEHWQAGHALLRVMQPFSRERHKSIVDALIARFPAARFSAGARAANSDPAPVFVVGMPRSGTTLCEQILAAHAQVHGAGERAALAGAAIRFGGGDGPAAIERIARLKAADLDRAATSYLAELHALAPDKARIVDKMPGNTLFLGLAGLMLPGAKIIHCVRDPRDIGLSIFTLRFHGTHGYAHDLGDLGWMIAETDRLMAHWKCVLPNPVLTVRLADWIVDFDRTLARVLAHLDLPPDPACARFYERTSRVRTASRAQVRQPINANGLGRWHRYADSLTPLIAELDSANALAGWNDSAGLTNAQTPRQETP